jgi:hypothetical protein
VVDPDTGHYLIVAGPVTDALGFALYEWRPGTEARKLRDISGGFTPEALFFGEKSSSGLDTQRKVIHLLSDDGSLSEKEKRCSKLPASKQRFRMMDLELDGL